MRYPGYRPTAPLSLSVSKSWRSRSFRFRNFREALTFVQEIGGLAEAEGHHPDISLGWGNATVSPQTKKIKGLHENDFIMATKIDRIYARTTTV
jgi:4a-hydroxytetrahydrobiopterin dehydratase